MAKRIEVNLFGKSGQRSIEITTPSIVSPAAPEIAEAVGLAQDLVSALVPDTKPRSQPDPVVAPKAVVDVLQKMTHDDDRTTENGWFIIDEILFVAAAKCGIRANATTLLDAFRDLYRREIVEHKTNRFDQHVFKLAENWEEAEWRSDPEAQREYKEWCEELERRAAEWEQSQLGEVYIKALNCPEPWE